MTSFIFEIIYVPLQKLCDVLNWWSTPDKLAPVPCPYCKNSNRLEPYNGGCQYTSEHPEYGVSGADPPCLCDSFACAHARHLGISC